MSNFDIGTLLDFKPPKFFCENCKALLYQVSIAWKKEEATCPVCKVKYLPSKQYNYYQVHQYLKDNGHTLHFEDPIKQGQKLAAIAYNLNQGKEHYPPMRALFETLNGAKKFIHFTTFGLSHILFGALKLKAQSIPIRGIAANIHPDFATEIKDYSNEAPNLAIQIFTRNDSGQKWSNIPHQKLIVVDGLMAFKGAANMTNDGWRKAASGRDHVEVVTNIKEVVELNNKLFSPIWADLRKSNALMMEDEIPF